MIGWVLRWGVVREASDWDAVEEVSGWRRMFVFGISVRGFCRVLSFCPFYFFIF